VLRGNENSGKPKKMTEKEGLKRMKKKNGQQIAITENTDWNLKALACES